MNDGFNHNHDSEKKARTAYTDDAFSGATATAVLDGLKETLAKQTAQGVAATRPNTHQGTPKQEAGLDGAIALGTPNVDHGAVWHKKPHLAATVETHVVVADGEADTPAHAAFAQGTTALPLSGEPLNSEAQAGRRIYRHDDIAASETKVQPDKKVKKESKGFFKSRDKNAAPKEAAFQAQADAQSKQKFGSPVDDAHIEYAENMTTQAPVAAQPTAYGVPRMSQATPITTVQNVTPIQQTTPTTAAHTAAPIQQVAPTTEVHNVASIQQTTPTTAAHTAAPIQKAAPTTEAHNAAPIQQATPTTEAHNATPIQQATPITAVQNVAPIQQATPTTEAHNAASIQQTTPITATHNAAPVQQVVPTTAAQNVPQAQQAAPTTAVTMQQAAAGDSAAVGKRIFRAESTQKANEERYETPSASDDNARSAPHAATYSQPRVRENRSDVLGAQVAVQSFHATEPQDKQTKRFVKKMQANQSRRSEKSVAYIFFVICIVVMLLLTGYSALYQNNLPSEPADNTNQGQSGVIPAPEDKTKPSAPPVSMYEKDGVTYLEIEGYEMILVNKAYELPKSYDYGIDLNAQAAFEAMAQAAGEDGLTIYISSGFRSYETQYFIYNRNVSYYGEEEANSFSAKPGQSEHQTGLAFDLAGTTDSNAILTNSFKDTPEYAWLAQHAAEYGFILRYPEGKMNVTGYIFEPWHYRYVGPELAQILKESGQTVEEYAGLAG